MDPVRLDAMAELFGRTVADAIGSPDESARVHAELTVCAEVVRNLIAYMPLALPFMPDEVVPLLRMSFDEMREAVAADPRTAQAVGRYRFDVTEAEAANAQRLQTVCSTVQTLIRLRDKAPDVGTVDRMLELVGNWVHQQWGVDAPLQGDVRAWARKQTWRTDVLPKAMRHL